MFPRPFSPPIPDQGSGDDSSSGSVANQYVGEDGLYLLHSAIAIGASYDSVERYPPPRCHPQTRMVIFEIILAWLKDSTHGPSIMLIHGSGGSGKSAISQTVAEYCAQSGQLGATFFFSHGKGDLSNGKLVFPTLAYKLASSIPEIRSPLSRAIQVDTSVLTQSLNVQVQKLIVEPFKSIPHPIIPWLIIIDALDACEDDETQHQILSLIVQLLVVHRLPLCFIITGRLQPNVQATFDTPILRKLSNRINLDTFTSDIDVRTFLRSEFSSIRHYHRHIMAAIPEPWPSDDVIELLVQKSCGQFLYPSTVVKFVDDKSIRPAERLVEVVVAAASDSVLSPVDQLYHHILSSSTNHSVLLRALGTIVVLFSPLSSKAIELLLDLRHGELCEALKGMYAIVDVPDPAISPVRTAQIHQMSVVEFLMDAERSLQFWIDPRRHHTDLVRGCIRYIAEYMDNADKLDPTSSLYIRRKWTLHLSQATPSAELMEDLREPRFLYSRVLSEVRAVVGWLKYISSPPQDVLHLWRTWESQLLGTPHFIP
ncbi:hypothetical protein B0H10DRAFT_1374912 [Mycena sp. CBHHK59/15]|nr:hypothetical protein B0H10DRAFT_1374912 [Mycena sp. CBHHK59/15]